MLADLNPQAWDPGWKLFCCGHTLGNPIVATVVALYVLTNLMTCSVPCSADPEVTSIAARLLPFICHFWGSKRENHMADQPSISAKNIGAYWHCFGELSENSKTVVLVFRSYHTLVTVSTWLVHRSCAFYPPYVRSKHLQENKIWNTFPCCGNTWWNDMLLATVIVVSIQVWWTLVFIEIVPMFLTFLSQCDIG